MAGDEEKSERGFTVVDRRASSAEGEDATPPVGGSGGEGSELPGIDFATFVISLGTSALYHMGLVDDPETGKPAERNLLLAFSLVVAGHERVVQDAEHPCLAVGARLVAVPKAIRAQRGFLHQVFGVTLVAGEPECGAVERAQVGQRFGLEVGSHVGRIAHVLLFETGGGGRLFLCQRPGRHNCTK